jgi:hypothetical protein
MESNSKFNFPYELKDAVNGMDHEIRIKILEGLINQEKMNYSDIKKELTLNDNQKGILNYHLKILSQSALIDKYTTSLGNDSEERSYYKLSQFAIKLIHYMMTVFDPPNTDYKISSPYETLKKEWSISYYEPISPAGIQHSEFRYENDQKEIKTITSQPTHPKRNSKGSS